MVDKTMDPVTQEALDYIASFNWVNAIESFDIAYLIDGVIALVRVKISSELAAVDRCLWVVAGDLPSAYFVQDNAHTPNAALSIYCELMADWIGAVRNGSDLSEVYPVEASPTIENAEALETRIRFIRSRVIAELEK